MPLFRQRAFMRSLLTIAAVLIGLILAEPVAIAQQHREVLVLFSTRRDAPISVMADRELPQMIEQGLAAGVDYFSEYIDVARIPTGGYLAAFHEFLTAKYRGRKFDLVVAVQDAAVDFLVKYRDELFAGIPVVYLAMTPPARAPANSTGVIVDVDLAATLKLALALQPDLRNVFVVSGAGVPDKGYETRARAQLRQFEPRLTISYLAGLSTPDLEARLASLPKHSIVYYLVVYQDGAGTLFSPLKYLDRIVAVANAPTYSWSESTMDHGIVGGKLLGPRAMLEAVAALSLRVLRGEPAATIAPSSPDLSLPEVDWRQLNRWGLSEARVPAGTGIKFKVPGVWERYRAYILGAITLMLAQSLLIAGLLLQRSRRRQAEERDRGSQAALHTSHERIRDLGSRLLNAQESERTRLARELHDDIGQQMALLEIDLEMLSQAMPPGTQELAGGALDRVQGLARSIHDLSHRLHPARLRLIGLVAALRGLQREMSQPGMAIVLTHDEHVPANLPLDLTLCLFRVAQEALQNAVKYSRATRVALHLGASPGRLSMTITDDGIGFDVASRWGRGLGLISMVERIEALGGTLEISSSPGAGTRLAATLPAPADVAAATEPSVRANRASGATLGRADSA